MANPGPRDSMSEQTNKQDEYVIVQGSPDLRFGAIPPFRY